MQHALPFPLCTCGRQCASDWAELPESRGRAMPDLAELPVPVIWQRIVCLCASDLAELPIYGEACQEIGRNAWCASDLAELSPVCGGVCQ